MFKWIWALELNQNRQIISGSEKALSDAVGQGADLRVGTTFRHNEHIDTDSINTELMREVIDFCIVYLLKIIGLPECRICVCLYHLEEDLAVVNRDITLCTGSLADRNSF